MYSDDSIQLLGVYQGKVISVEDDKQMDRVDAIVPVLFSGAIIEKIRPVTIAPGWSWKPAVDDFVWIMFENGDPERGLYFGSWWPLDKETQETALLNEAKTNYPNTRVLTTPAGHKVEFDDTEDATKIKVTSAGHHTVELDDTSGSEKVKITSSGGHEFELDDGGTTVTLKHSGGTTELVIDNAGKVVLTGATEIEFKGGGGAAPFGVVCAGVAAHLCAFTGGPHPAGSGTVKASP